MLKRLALWALVGILIGDVISILLGIKAIGYWFEPPGQPAAFNCTPQATLAMEYLARFQAWGSGIGALLFLVFGFLVQRRAAGRKGAGKQENPGGQNPTPTV